MLHSGWITTVTVAPGQCAPPGWTPDICTPDIQVRGYGLLEACAIAPRTYECLLRRGQERWLRWL